ncbi:MAG: hypothetical protein NVV59_09315 [Chitinophagaceae bacterium]|nr:hypothetical protein [Chitinophagaceae bacterium]
MIGEGRNNFIIEYNEPENRLAELEDEIREAELRDAADAEGTAENENQSE